MQVDWSAPLPPSEDTELWAVRASDDARFAALVVDVAAAEQLDAIDVNELSADENVALLGRLEQLRARVDGLQQQVLTRVVADIEARDEGSGGPGQAAKQYYVDEVAATLRIANRTAMDRIMQAELLVNHLPDTVDRMRRGEVSLLQARMIYQAVAPTIDRLGADSPASDQVRAVLEQVQDRIGPRLGELTCGQVRAEAERLVQRLAPVTAETAHRHQYEQRKVTARPEPDGMATLTVYSGADEVIQIFTTLTAAADALDDDDPRTMPQRRADLIHAWSIPAETTAAARTTAVAAGDGRPGVLPLWQGRRPAIQVTVALSTLLGLDDQPAELAGHGSIPASLARRIAADPTGTWSRIITDPLGRVLDYRQRVYRPPADLREHVLARDGTCRFPICNRSARRCELDHVHEYQHGGPTRAANLQALCPRHHHLKSETDWTVERDHRTGDTVWTDPHGRRHIQRAHTLPGDRTAASVTSADDPPPF